MAAIPSWALRGEKPRSSRSRPGRAGITPPGFWAGETLEKPDNAFSIRPRQARRKGLGAVPPASFAHYEPEFGWNFTRISQSAGASRHRRRSPSLAPATTVGCRSPSSRVPAPMLAHQGRPTQVARVLPVAIVSAAAHVMEPVTVTLPKLAFDADAASPLRSRPYRHCHRHPRPPDTPSWPTPAHWPPSALPGTRPPPPGPQSARRRLPTPRSAKCAFPTGPLHPCPDFPGVPHCPFPIGTMHPPPGTGPGLQVLATIGLTWADCPHFSYESPAIDRCSPNPNSCTRPQHDGGP